MKKILFVLIGIALFIPVSTHALTGKVSVVCEKTSLTPGETTSCAVKGTSNELVVSAVADVLSSENLKIGKINIPEPWQGNGNDGKIALYASITDNIKENFDIATFKVTASKTAKTGDTATIALKNVQLGDSNFNGTELSSGALDFKIVSNKTDDEPNKYIEGKEVQFKKTEIKEDNSNKNTIYIILAVLLVAIVFVMLSTKKKKRKRK